MGSIIPIIPFAIDSSTTRDVAKNATIITTRAATRSDQGARRKNSHHTGTARPPKIPPNTLTTGYGTPNSARATTGSSGTCSA